MMKNFKKLLVLAFALVVAATVGVSTTAEAASKFKKVSVTNNVTAKENATTITLAQRGKAALKAVASPSAKVTFKSSNTKIATVTSKGVITAKRKGTAKIYVRFTRNGYASVTKTIYVKVVTGRVTSVAISGNKVVATGGATTLKATVKGTDKTINKAVKWVVPAKYASIVKVNPVTGKVIGRKMGKAYVYAVATDGSKKMAKVVVTVKNKVTAVAMEAGYPTELKVGQTNLGFNTTINKDAFNTKTVLKVVKGDATVARIGSTNKFTVRANKKGDIVLRVYSSVKNPNGAYVKSKDYTVKAVDKNVVKVTPKVGTTATATITGSPKAIAADLEEALTLLDASPADVTVTVDGVKKTIAYKDGKVTVDGKPLSQIQTTSGVVSVEITTGFAKYVEKMDILALSGKMYDYKVTVGKRTFELVQTDGTYVTVFVDGVQFKAYNEGSVLCIVGTKADLGTDLVADLEKVATVE